MSLVITPSQLAVSISTWTVLDVRKDGARRSSMQTIPGAIHRKPFDAENWWRHYAGRKVIVFCVHGAEVSQGVRGFLRDNGIDAAHLQGGFDAWQAAGLPVEAI